MTVKASALFCFLLTFSLCGALDPCTRLCIHDGPTDCTGGSWTKAGDICHGYFYIGNPRHKNYCYYNPSVAPSCRASGEPVRSRDVPNLIENRSSTTTNIPHVPRSLHGQTSGTTATSTNGDTLDFAGLFEFFDRPLESLGEYGRWLAWRSRVRDAYPASLVEIPVPLEASDRNPDGIPIGPLGELARMVIAQKFNRFQLESLIGRIQRCSDFVAPADYMKLWQDVRGKALVGAARNTDLSDLDVSVIMLTTSMRVPMGDESIFGQASGISSFCADRAERIRDSLAEAFSSNWDNFKYQELFSWNRLQLYCPDLFDTPQMRFIALNQRIQAFSLNVEFRSLSMNRIKRVSAFNTAVGVLMSSKPETLRRGIGSIRFEGEDASGPGVIREWFTEASNQIFDPSQGLFTIRPDYAPHYIEIRPRYTVISAPLLRKYRAVGRFLAVAVVQKQTLGVNLPVSFFARLIDQPLVLSDIEKDDPYLFSSYSDLIRMTAEELEAAGIEILGQVLNVENRVSLIDAVINDLMPTPEAVQQFGAIKVGFTEVIPTQVFPGIFSAADLQGLIRGDPHIDIDDLISSMVLVNYRATDNQILWLWSVLRSFDPESKRKFFRFVTGTEYAPIGGCKNLLPRRIHLDDGGIVKNLPTSNTCSNTLHLPRYDSHEELRTKVRIAINADSAMGNL